MHLMLKYDTHNTSIIFHNLFLCYFVALPFGEENRPSCNKLRISCEQKDGKNNEEESDRSFCKPRRGEDILIKLMSESTTQGSTSVYDMFYRLHNLLYWAQFPVVFINNSCCFCFCSCPFIMFANTKSV